MVEVKMMMRELRVGVEGVRSEARQRLKVMLWCVIEPLIEFQVSSWRRSEGREEVKWLLCL